MKPICPCLGTSVPHQPPPIPAALSPARTQAYVQIASSSWPHCAYTTYAEHLCTCLGMCMCPKSNVYLVYAPMYSLVQDEAHQQLLHVCLGDVELGGEVAQPQALVRANERDHYLSSSRWSSASAMPRVQCCLRSWQHISNQAGCVIDSPSDRDHLGTQLEQQIVYVLPDEGVVIDGAPACRCTNACQSLCTQNASCHAGLHH